MKRSILLCAFALAACGPGTGTPSAPTEAFDLPADAVVLGFRQTMYTDGIVAGVVTADTAFVHQEGEERAELFGVDVVFHDERGARAGTLTSRTGEFSGSMFVARGDAVLITEGPQGPRELRTDELHFDMREDRIWTDVAFTHVEAGRTSQGTSFRTDFRFDSWVVTGLQSTGAVPADAATEF